MHELRFAVRIFAKSPGLAAVNILLIAFGTGLNTALFSLLHAAILESGEAQTGLGGVS